jgi:uncharacterized protein (TIGR02421 family)
VDSICQRLSKNKTVRRRLPGRGRVHIDRQLPFLCVYRRRSGGRDRGTERLVTSEASYVLAPAGRGHEVELKHLVQSIVRTLEPSFGAFLVLEIWSRRQDHDRRTTESEEIVPRFRVFVPGGSDLGSADSSMEEHLERIRLAGKRAEVSESRKGRWSPPRLSPLLTASEAERLNCSVVGLEVDPVFRDPVTGDVYPIVLRQLRRGLTRALRRTFYDFTRSRTRHLPEHFHVLGRRSIVKAVWEVDRCLAEVSDSFDLLLQVSPVNAAEAWRDFERRRFDRAPAFRYRPLPVDPVQLKRWLYRAPIERIEDPALYDVLREKQDEIDRRVTLLIDLNSRRFLPGSIQLYGRANGTLLHAAERILARVPPRAREKPGGGTVSAEAFAARAREEIAHYRRTWDGVQSTVTVRDDLLTGLMVSQGSLLIGRDTRIAGSRVEALVHHEVGTHILTYCNGRAQGFRQLYSGLAGYEALQEGIAVLAEYLVGGLSAARMRVLAARVVAVRHLLDGADFVESFRALRDRHGFSGTAAFSIATRVYRGGGFTKDAVYLRGLGQVLDYLAGGGALDPLFVGKIAVKHVPIVRELALRGVLTEAPLRPRYLDRPEVQARLRGLGLGMRLDDLLPESRHARSRPGTGRGRARQ